ncbi:phage tail tape measure protein [Neisseria bacilliformis]|uniref:phage tail tape measure protein n=1 Tax=Neisseria bacilliformis TaxID=267212 RepID=UPI003C77C1C8
MAKEFLVGVTIAAALKAGFTTVFGRAERTAKSLGSAIKEATHANDAFGRSIRQQQRLMPSRNLSEQSRAFAAMTMQIHRATRAQNDLNKAIAGQRAAQQHRQQLRSEMVETAGHAAVIAAPVVGSIRKFMEQEDASANLKISMMRRDGSFGRFNEIDRLTTEWGAALPGNKTDFTNMALGLKSQGISDETIINGGGLATARLNTVMGIPIADGSFFAKNMEAHGIKESELLRSADLTQRAYFAAGLTKEDMYQAMSYYAPKVNTLGLTGLENQKQIYAVEGLAANKGLEGSSFGTNFNMMLSQLSKGPAMMEMAAKGMKTEVRDMVEKSGAHFDFFNKDGSMKSLREITGTLESEFGKVRARFGDKGVMDVADALFGQEGGRVASILGQAGLGGFDAMIAKMEQQASLEDRIKVKTSTLSGAIEALGGMAENAAAKFGEVFAPDLKRFAAFGQNVIEQYAIPFISKHKEAIKVAAGLVVGLIGIKLAFLGIAYTLSMVAMPLRSVWIGFQKIRSMQNMWRLFRMRGISRGVSLLRTFGMSAKWATRVAGGLGRVAAPFASVFGRIGQGAGVFGKLNVALGLVRQGFMFLARSLLTTPIGWVIMALVFAAVLIYKYWKPLKAFFAGFWEGLTKGLEPLTPLFDAFVGTLSGIWTAVQPYLQPVLDWFGDFFNLTQAGEGNARSWGESVGSALASVVNTVVSVGTMIVDGWRMIFDGIFSLADSAWTQIKTAFDGGLLGILGLILNWSPIGAFYSAFAAVLSWFGIDLPARFTEFGSNIIQGLWNGLQAKFEAVRAWFAEKAAALKNTFAGVMDIHSPSRVFRRFGGWMMEGLQIGINQGAPRPFNAIGGVASDLQQRFTNHTSSLAASMAANSAELSAARQGTAAAGGITVHFSPTINAPGGDAGQIQAAMQLGLREFEQLFERLMADKARRAY